MTPPFIRRISRISRSTLLAAPRSMKSGRYNLTFRHLPHDVGTEMSAQMFNFGNLACSAPHLVSCSKSILSVHLDEPYRQGSVIDLLGESSG